MGVFGRFLLDTAIMSGIIPKIIGPSLAAASVYYQVGGILCAGGAQTTFFGFQVVEANGTQHHLVPDPGVPRCSVSNTADRYAADGSGWFFKGSSTLYRKDGT